VQGYTRRQLKEDKFAEKTKDAVQWTAGHQRSVFWVLGALLVVLAGYFGYSTWDSRQSEAANVALGDAMRTFTAQLRPAGTPPGEGEPTFTSIAERAKAAEKEFNAIADKYSLTKPGKIARYMEGVSAMQAGDSAGAEQKLRSVADSTDKSIAALAKMALAGQYRAANKLSDATRIYKDLQDHPTDTVSKVQAQLAMAEMYESSDPQLAESIYKQIQKDAPDNPAARFAAERLNTAK
jgi:predicted negative regulator of RcsB-dependent stress response